MELDEKLIGREFVHFRRGCMEKWWKVPRHRPLSSVQRQKAVDFLMEWIRVRLGEVDSPVGTPDELKTCDPLG